jgi:hypothetical protein
MSFDIERELARAMSAAVEELPAPRIDMARIRRRSRSRRLVLPAVIVTAGAVATVPIAAGSHNGPADARTVGDVVGPVHAATTSPHPAPASTIPPPPAGVPGEQADAVRVPTATASATCWTAPRPLTKEDRAGVVRQVQAAVAAEVQALNQRLAGITKVSIPEAELDQLVPPAGTLVEQSGCGDDGQISEAAGQELVAAASSVVAALTGVLADTLGKLGVSDVPVTVTIAAGEDGALIVRIAVDGGSIVSGTITATIRAESGEAVETDTSQLRVQGVAVPDLPDVTDPADLPGVSELPGLAEAPELPAVPTVSPVPDLPGLPSVLGGG